MKSYVLVHGAWSAAWEFKRVAEFLSADGNSVMALDLPGHGANTMPVGDVTMDMYVQEVSNAVSGSINKSV